MKKFITIIFTLSILLGGLRPIPAHAATFAAFDLEGTDDTPGAEGVTYTISFTTVTEVLGSDRILYAIWPTGFIAPSDQNDVVITVNGVPQTIDIYGNWSSNLQFISIANTVAAGSEVVATINNVTNAGTGGVHTFTWIRSANGAGGAIDEASPTPTISLASSNHTLTYSAGAGGTLSGTTSQSVADGANGTAVTAVPNTGYYFVQWSDSETDNPRTDLAVSGDITVSAQFARISRTLTYVAQTGGTITGSMSQTVLHGDDGSPVTAVPGDGYYFAGWSDGVEESSRTDIEVDADINVTAQFLPNTPRPIIAPVGSGFEQEPQFTINDGAKETTSRDVTLTFDVGENSAVAYAAAQDQTLSGVAQQPFSKTVTFRLQEKLGEQTVYVYLYSTTGQPSKLLEQTISLVSELSSEQDVQAEVQSESVESGSVGEATAVAIKTSESEPQDLVQVVEEKNAYQFIRNLRLGDTGEDVEKLREFLDARGFVTARIPLSDLTVEERQTFGPGLFRAVVAYQEKNPEEILTPIELTKGTGNFFEYTRAFVNKVISLR